MRNFIAIAALTIADLVSKSLVLAKALTASGLVAEITSFFNIYLVWNTGVSFSMFNNGGEIGRWLLVVVAAVIAAFVVRALRKSKTRQERAAFVLVIAGAIGNIYDRVVFGAVRDFLDFHIGTSHFPAFNLADSFICIGVFLLLIKK